MDKIKTSMKSHVKKDFLSLFRILEKTKKPDKAPDTTFFVLKAMNGEFIYSDLKASIAENIVAYALSRKQYDEYKKYDSKPYLEAVKKLVDKKSNTGEFGEIMLFSFLESDLGAPKIATKLELKTSTNEYVKGSDGVHLLKTGKNSFQIVFGESKTSSSSPNSAVTKAINSIHDFKNRKKNNINDEIQLIQIHLDREFEKAEKDFIKKILIPSETPEGYNVEWAFGIFIGVNFHVDENWRKLSGIDFEEKIDKELKIILSSLFPHLCNKISERKLENCKFYVYFLPIENIAKKRKKLLPQENGK